MSQNEKEEEKKTKSQGNEGWLRQASVEKWKKKMGKRAVPGGYIENISLSEMKCVPEDKERNSKRKER